MEAQQKASALIGEYYLSGVMETASGFKLNPDSTFQFFFSYGALDRSGSGTWKQVGNNIIFNSKPGTGGFALVGSSTVDNDKLNIQITDANPSLRSHVYAMLRSGSKQSEQMTDKNGLISFPKQEADSIMLILEFCPEKSFIFSNNNKLHNNFEFRFEQDMMEVFFDHFSLSLHGEEGLEGHHPLLKEGTYHFKKN
ncbi:MAG: hypothetical protein ABI741_09890 [Ferruginibacter sp.]